MRAHSYALRLGHLGLVSEDDIVSTVRVTRFVDCPFSAVIEFAEETLRGRRDITLSPAPPLRHHVHLDSQLTDDLTDTSRKHDALLLAWQPSLARLFPDFHGALTVRPKARGAWMRIQGSYDPPFGLAGRIFDALAGRFIAQLTLMRLLRDIAHTAERRWHACRQERPA